MAQHLTPTQLRSYPLSNGTTADLIALIKNNRPGTWVRAETVADAPVGTVAYVSAMGAMRRGVVVKTTKTKVHVALTTQGAVDSAASYESYHGYLRGSQPVRVQTVVADPETIFIAPKPEPVQPEMPGRDEAHAKLAQATEAMHAQDEQVEGWLARHAELGTPHTQWSDVEDYRQADHDEALTLNSQAGKVDSMNNDASTETAPAVTRETTGSAVVQLLEKVWARIRQNHPELPGVVIVTGAGMGLGGGKWGHFRANGWTAKAAEAVATEGVATSANLHEMFMAGETLAKGARQVLQTMLHEGAHTLARVREIQETSRQGRWHNAKFKTLAGEMGLEYTKGQADGSLGFSQVTLTEETVAEYSDLLDALEAEIHLMVSLPGWLGGDAGQDGGENMPKGPKGPAAPNTNNVKATCKCEEPNIVRMSHKVLALGVVRCTDCDHLFRDRS